MIQEAEALRLGVFTFEDDNMATEPPKALQEDNATLDYQEATEVLDDNYATQAEKREALQTLKQLWDNGLIMAAHQLGRAYRDGLGVLPDDEKAELWFRHSAEAGNNCSQCALGTLLLEQGQSSEAVSWYERAAATGNQYAQYSLGKLYLQSKSIPQNVSRAEKYLTAAAEQGNQYAQYALGKLYLSGNKIPQNKAQAAYWLTQSAAQGHRYAQFLLDRLDENQSPAVLLSATRLLHHMSRVFQETPPPSNPVKSHVDSKLMQRIREKKIAAGHKPDDHEEQGYAGPAM